MGGMMRGRIFALILSIGLTTPAFGDQKPKLDPVATVTGRVMMDTNGSGKLDAGDKGLGDVLVSDGIQFVRTAADGSFTLKLADDPLIPYKPAQVISVCWPSGTWPVARQYYFRRSEIRPGQSVDFLLREQKQQLPFTFAHGSDPHDNTCGGELFAADVAGMGNHVKFCLMTGDLGYASRESADKMFTSIRAATLRFPIPMLHTPGNHDICDIHTTKWSEREPLAGYGPYTQYLGPVRYSFTYAGVHFVALDWARIMEDGKLQTGVPDTVIDWLKKDLAHLKPGTRTFVFMHHDFRHGDDKFWDVLVEHKIELVIAGHSHRNKEETRRGIKRLTTQNLCGPYRLLTIHDKGHSIVNRCFTGSAVGHAHSYAGKCKMSEWKTLNLKRGMHTEILNQEVNGSHIVPGFQAQQMEILADIEPRDAKKIGLRVGSAHVIISTASDQLSFDEVQTPAVRGREDKHYQVRVIVAAGKVLVFANNRVQFERPLTLTKPAPVELNATEGKCVYRKLDLWEIKGE